MGSITITIPGDPVAKGRPRITTRGGHARAYTPKKTAAWAEHARLSARAAMKGRKPFTGAIHVTIEAVFDPPKSWPKWKREAAYNGDLRHVVKPDVDNLAKQIDAFNGVLWVDDAQIDGLTIYKTYATDPRTIVKVQDTWESMTEAK